MERLEVDAKLENLDLVLGFLEQGLEKTTCTMRAKTQIAVAAEEVFVNIAHYAYGDQTGKAVIQYEIFGDPMKMKIIFTDSGIPYDPLKKQDPNIKLSAEEREIGGLGIFMVKKMMDDVEYQLIDQKNVLTITKELG